MKSKYEIGKVYTNEDFTFRVTDIHLNNIPGKKLTGGIFFKILKHKRSGLYQSLLSSGENLGAFDLGSWYDENSKLDQDYLKKEKLDKTTKEWLK